MAAVVRERTGQTPPLTLTDGRHPEFRDFSAGYDPADPIDRAIMATRNAVFPLHGLDPLPCTDGHRSGTGAGDGGTVAMSDRSEVTGADRRSELRRDRTSPLTVDDLREHLVRTRIAGDVATSRENNLDHYRSLANRDPHHMFGLTLERRWSYRDVLELMAKSAGVVADPGHREGQDTIDPDRTIDATRRDGRHDRQRAPAEQPGS